MGDEGGMRQSVVASVALGQHLRFFESQDFDPLTREVSAKTQVEMSDQHVLEHAHIAYGRMLEGRGKEK